MPVSLVFGFFMDYPHLPEGLHYNYASSASSSSPYTPDFPSPQISNPLVYENPPDDGDAIYRQWSNYQNYPDSLISSPAYALQVPPQLMHPYVDSAPTIHAPVPQPGPHPVLFSDVENYCTGPCASSQDLAYQCPGYLAAEASLSSSAPSSSALLESIESHQVEHVNHPSIPAQAHSTFPTPSELLVDLAEKETAMLAAAKATADLNKFLSEKKPETARTARRRAIAKSIGFVPTDPDTISSHEKKRYYLECLEHYVMYLHEQIRLVGREPVPLERAPNHRGLSSRSIRTLLVHMENSNRKLNTQTLAEEQRFLALREAVYRQDAAARGHQYTHAAGSHDGNSIR